MTKVTSCENVAGSRGAIATRWWVLSETQLTHGCGQAYNSRRYGLSTREVLLNLLRNLRQTTDEMWHCYEMTWRTYSALVAMFPDQFPGNYQQA